jgi:hypothetical protein
MKNLDAKAKKAGRKLLKPGLEEAVSTKAKGGQLTCAQCFIIADELKVPPQEVGRALDLLDVHITKCQLGLFGNSPVGKIVQKAETVPEELEKAIRAGIENGRISCESSWRLAEKFALPRIKISSACEAMGVKISLCQLGAF